MGYKTTKDNSIHYVLGTSCFGDFNVYVMKKGREISWRTRKAKELFAYFIHMQGKPVGRNELIVRLWPDSYPDNAVKLLHNMIYSIRMEMSKNGIRELIQYKDGKYSLNMDYVFSDLNEMLYLLEYCKNEKDNAMDGYQKFLNGYLGAYMDNIDCDWSYYRREYFEQYYLKGCKHIAETHQLKGEYEQALHYLKLALQVDPYSESVVMQILKCYGAVKDLKNIKQYFNRYQELLEKEFEIKPGTNLFKAYQESIRNALA